MKLSSKEIEERCCDAEQPTQTSEIHENKSINISNLSSYSSPVMVSWSMKISSLFLNTRCPSFFHMFEQSSLMLVGSHFILFTLLDEFELTVFRGRVDIVEIKFTTLKLSAQMFEFQVHISSLHVCHVDDKWSSASFIFCLSNTSRMTFSPKNNKLILIDYQIAHRNKIIKVIIIFREEKVFEKNWIRHGRKMRSVELRRLYGTPNSTTRREQREGKIKFSANFSAILGL